MTVLSPVNSQCHRVPEICQGQVAEGVGFEPTIGCPMPVFKTGAFNRSATPPYSLSLGSCGSIEDGCYTEIGSKGKFCLASFTISPVPSGEKLCHADLGGVSYLQAAFSGASGSNSEIQVASSPAQATSSPPFLISEVTLNDSPRVVLRIRVCASSSESLADFGSIITS